MHFESKNKEKSIYIFTKHFANENPLITHNTFHLVDSGEERKGSMETLFPLLISQTRFSFRVQTGRTLVSGDGDLDCGERHIQRTYVRTYQL